MSTIHCDVAVIGAGTAGLAAERSARAAGARTLLIDDRYAGTTCATVGCMPSKLLIAAAHAAHAVRRAPLFGIGAQAPQVDGRAVLARVRAQRDAFVAATLASIGQIPDGIRLTATARFLDRSTLALDDGRQVRAARAVVIATGSRPVLPPGFDALGDRVLTNETVFELPDLPRSVAVVGAGPLGLELAQAFARLGVDTAVYGHGRTLAGLRDAEVSGELQAILERELPIQLGVDVSAEPAGDGVLVSWSGGSAGSRRYDRVLAAAGRAPRCAGLGLETTGLALDDHGTPRHDARTMQCGDAPIFIAGDADGERAVLHEASAEGAIAGCNAASFPQVRRAGRHVAFAITFTDPPVAVVGRPRKDGDVVGRASYADQGRAKVEARNAGLARLYAAPADGRLVGAVLAGPGADHLGHLVAWSIERGETATQLLDRPFYHPTVEEGLKPALREICKTVQAPLQPDRDQGLPPGA